MIPALILAIWLIGVITIFTVLIYIDGQPPEGDEWVPITAISLLWPYLIFCGVCVLPFYLLRWVFVNCIRDPYVNFIVNLSKRD